MNCTVAVCVAARVLCYAHIHRTKLICLPQNYVYIETLLIISPHAVVYDAHD